MSKVIAGFAISGARKVVNLAESDLNLFIKEKGLDALVAFPDTNYYLPFAYAMLALKAQKASDLVQIINFAKTLLHDDPTDSCYTPYLGPALDSGMATLFAAEIIEALKYARGNNPATGLWSGFTPDGVLREQGIRLVDGRMSGFAAIVGAAPTSKDAVKIIRKLQERRILVFMSGESNGVNIAEQLEAENIKMGLDSFLIPYGKDLTSTIYAINFAVRAAMTFGGITPKGPKEAHDILLYNKNRVNAFVLALGPVDDLKASVAAGAINFGFPVIADTDIDQILVTGVCKYEHVVSPVSVDKIVEKGIEVRGIKVTIDKPDVPVPYGPAFEGERVRKEETCIEMGGKASKAFEYVRMRKLEEVENGKIEVIGPEISEADCANKKALPFALVIDVAGRKMQSDFEPVLERRIHTSLSEAMGVMHIGQRDMNWIRISKDAVKAGFKLRHLGVIMHSILLKDFPSIVDKVQVTIYTKEEDILKRLPEALKAFDERDARIAHMTDESVDVYYSCKLCQSFAPNHICIISPERLGLCGAYNWLDGKAASEINPTGGNEPVKKGKTIDEKKGEWETINEYMYNKSNKTTSRMSLYSIMDAPTTSCGCFECIVALIPEANGVMIVDRNFNGMTPCGMKFTTLAGSVGGGEQVPGFLGVGRLYITSKKFISAEGGLKRIVWMPKELKESLAGKLKKRCEEIGDPDFINKIADETVATTVDELLPYLEKVNHPALTMESIM